VKFGLISIWAHPRRNYPIRRPPTLAAAPPIVYPFLRRKKDDAFVQNISIKYSTNFRSRYDSKRRFGVLGSRCRYTSSSPSIPRFLAETLYPSNIPTTARCLPIELCSYRTAMLTALDPSPIFLISEIP
jgi:hypothetical protein